MPWKELVSPAVTEFNRQFKSNPTLLAYAPGRVEVLGNHTDYNQGFVLSAAIDRGVLFAAAPSNSTRCTILTIPSRGLATFDVHNTTPGDPSWANYIKGVLAGIAAIQPTQLGFNAVLAANIPSGAGLSSSAALEMAAALAITQLNQLTIDKITLARIGQQAEHKWVGVKCGLLDQISSLFGRANSLVQTDFRSLAVSTVPFDHNACLLLCNTNVKHALVDSAYNERRASCEQAAAYFAKALPRPIHALRDVSWTEWNQHHHAMTPAAASRSAHVIGENERVLQGAELLAKADLPAFGKLMFQSHESSRTYFENSCTELDFVVDTARKLPGVLGARLSGGGFGGSAVILLDPEAVPAVSSALRTRYQERFNSTCDTLAAQPSDGATLVQPT